MRLSRLIVIWGKNGTNLQFHGSPFLKQQLCSTNDITACGCDTVEICGPAEISSYAFWVKCTLVSAHIRVTQARQSKLGRGAAGSDGKFNRLIWQLHVFVCSPNLVRTDSNAGILVRNRKCGDRVKREDYLFDNLFGRHFRRGTPLKVKQTVTTIIFMCVVYLPPPQYHQLFFVDSVLK